MSRFTIELAKKILKIVIVSTLSTTLLELNLQASFSLPPLSYSFLSTTPPSSPKSSQTRPEFSERKLSSELTIGDKLLVIADGIEGINNQTKALQAQLDSLNIDIFRTNPKLTAEEKALLVQLNKKMKALNNTNRLNPRVVTTNDLEPELTPEEKAQLEEANKKMKALNNENDKAIAQQTKTK